MANLKTAQEMGIENFIKIISNNPLIIYEDIQGSPLYIHYNGEELEVIPKHPSNEPLNHIDLTIQKYYNPVYEFFNKKPQNVKSLLNKNWYFGFEYFFDQTPAHVSYDKKPKNGLILTHIIKGKKRIFNIDEIREYADLFDVDAMPIIFKGKLGKEQIKLIRYFLETSPEDLEFVFGEDNFAGFFYKILNPKLSHSCLMKKGKYQENLEKIIIRVLNRKKNEMNLSILNPLYQEKNKGQTNFSDVYSLILLNFLEFMQNFNMKKLKIKGKSKDRIYISIICQLFNYWMEEKYYDIKSWDFTIPPFFKEDRFKTNQKLISNKKTLHFIKDDEKIEYCFKVILTSFSKKRNKPIGVFTKTTMRVMNEFIDQINKLIDHKLKLERENDLKRKHWLNFEDYYKIEYPEDSKGKVYPDMYNKMIEPASNNSKKKGKGKNKGKNL